MNVKQKFGRKLGRLATVLLLALIMVAVAIPALAAEVTTLPISYQPGAEMKLAADGTKLWITGIPEGEDFEFVWVYFLNAKDYDIIEYQGVAERLNDNQRGNYIAFDLADMDDGDYYFKICRDDIHSEDSIWDYIYARAIPVKMKDGHISFVLPATYEKNKAIYSVKRTDADALEYYLQPAANIQSKDIALIKMAEEITAGCSDDYSKLLAIHDWVIANIWYDLDNFSDKRVESGPVDAMSALAGRKATSAGYANLTTALLRALNIPAKTIQGETINMSATWTAAQVNSSKVNHNWTEAYVDGRWVILDSTFDCGLAISGGVKITGEGYDGAELQKYFDMSLEWLSVTHRMNDYSEAAIPTTAPSAWAKEVVAQANKNELIPQWMYCKFQQNITRAQFCELVVCLIEAATDQSIDEYMKANKITLAANPYNDTYALAVRLCDALGIVEGYGGGRFNPDGSITREQAAIMLQRTAKQLDALPGESDPVEFSDKDKINTWSLAGVEYVSVCIDPISGKALMEGVGNNRFSPQGNYTREQAFITMNRLFNIVTD